ncbi:hypothetical protein [Halococcus saccharolyticus]|uniref:Uncharacterized protein n=1 Tax=Halococcus saccharolyticus DSM 5350 TaxID=1227455 RepID=M0MRH1_9EURY|nr:hypothetical protein [Halococcus saccharolyticus]EMA47958.1 hypothetical protein C449_00760 [Halococcus saccharolyticus DSM 5350]
MTQTTPFESGDTNEVPAAVFRAMGAIVQQMPECEFDRVAFAQMAGGAEIELEITSTENATWITNALEEHLTRCHEPDMTYTGESIETEVRGYLSAEDATALINDC